MFESKLCDRSTLKVPVDSDLWSFPWLSKPVLLVILLAIGFFGIRWILNNPERRRWLNSLQGFFVLFSVTVFLPLLLVAADRAITTFLTSNPNTRADAIVVVGRGWPLMHDRVNTVAELWKTGRAPKIFASGTGDTPHLIRLLKEQEIPDSAIDGENCSLTTEENAMFSAAILQPQGIRRIFLVTEEAHMLRTLLVYRAYGFTVFPSISPVPAHWNAKERGFLKLREYGGAISYALRGLFFEQRLSDLKNPDLKTLVQEAEKYAQKQRL